MARPRRRNSRDVTLADDVRMVNRVRESQTAAATQQRCIPAIRFVRCPAHSSQRRRGMKFEMKVGAVALMLGVAVTTAAAQTTSHGQSSFAAQFAQMQRLSTNSENPRGPAEIGNVAGPADPPSFADNFARMQAESSHSSQFKPQAVLAAQAADPRRNVPFAQRFAELQALSSNSDQYRFQRGAGVIAGEPDGTLLAGRAPAEPPKRRLATW
jgi:hypothetical protein